MTIMLGVILVSIKSLKYCAVRDVRRSRPWYLKYRIDYFFVNYIAMPCHAAVAIVGGKVIIQRLCQLTIRDENIRHLTSLFD